MTDYKIIEMPIQFHCKGMMKIIKQIIKEKIGAKLPDADIDLLLTEYAKYWYYSEIKGFTVVDVQGRKGKT